MLGKVIRCRETFIIRYEKMFFFQSKNYCCVKYNQHFIIKSTQTHDNNVI